MVPSIITFLIAVWIVIWRHDRKQKRAAEAEAEEYKESQERIVADLAKKRAEELARCEKVLYEHGWPDIRTASLEEVKKKIEENEDMEVFNAYAYVSTTLNKNTYIKIYPN